MNVPVAAGADCNLIPLKSKPATLAGHVKMTFVPEELMDSCGVNDSLNAVPLPELPPKAVIPYKVLPDKSRPAEGLAPSLLV